MKKLMLFIFLLGNMSFGFCQKAGLITVDQLHQRLAKGGDTTFIINFWATWCLPCKRELPGFEKFNISYKDYKVKVLLISVDFPSKLNSVLLPFLKKNSIKSEVFLLNEKNQQEYIDRIDKSWSGSLPATLFIHRDERIFFEKEFDAKDIIKEYQRINHNNETGIHN